MCKGWFGYSAQHCQMTVPKIILALFGSLGEISGPEMSDIMIQLTVGNYILSQIEDNFCLECNHYAPTGNMCSYRMILPESLDWSALEQTAPTNGQLSSENVSPTRLKRK